MVEIKLEVRLPTLMTYDVGERVFGWPIRATVPEGAHYIVDVPEDELGRLPDLVRSGAIRDWRYAHTYQVQWVPGAVRATANEAVGDTFPLIGAIEDARRAGRYGAGSLLLLVDTGLDGRHRAFAGKTLYGDTASDSVGHGTHVGSTMASAWGIASDAAIWVRNALPGGSGSEAGIANAIRAGADFAAQQRVPAALNLSLGGPPSQVIDQAVQYAQQRGVIVCAAAGNDPNASIGSPARVADLIVLACDRQRNPASFTSGRAWPNPQRCYAPGVDIAAAKSSTTGGILVASGTSMATPHITGVCGLLLAAGYTAREAAGVLRQCQEAEACV